MSSEAPVVGSLGAEERAGLGAGYPRAAHTGSIAEEEDLDRGFAPKADPIQSLPERVEQDLEAAAGVVERPIVEPQAREQRRADKPGDGRPEGWERCLD